MNTAQSQPLFLCDSSRLQTAFLGDCLCPGVTMSPPLSRAGCWAQAPGEVSSHHLEELKAAGWPRTHGGDADPRHRLLAISSVGQYWSSRYWLLSAAGSVTGLGGRGGRLWASSFSHCTSTSLYSSMAVWASSTDECPLLPT